MVYRKLHQNVATFRAWKRRAGSIRWQGEARCGVLGRWRDGTPLELAPDAPGSALVADRQRSTNFRTAPMGWRCPIGTRRHPSSRHAGFNGGLNRRRIMRRGLPYGSTYEGQPVSDSDNTASSSWRGIFRQFEFVQQQDRIRQRCPSGNDKDFLIGVTRKRKVRDSGSTDPKNPFICGGHRPSWNCAAAIISFCRALTGIAMMATNWIRGSCCSQGSTGAFRAPARRTRIRARRSGWRATAGPAPPPQREFARRASVCPGRCATAVR